jgi:hypothetical protein
VVGAPGFEPGASCAQGRRATRLRYAPTVNVLFHSNSLCNVAAIPQPIFAMAASRGERR